VAATSSAAVATAATWRSSSAVVAQYDRPDGVYMTHLHPRDVGGAILSIDAMDPPERWEWGGPDWRTRVKTDVSVAITGVDVQGDDPRGMSARWAEVLGRPVTAQGDAFVMALDHGTHIRFTPMRDLRGEGVSAIEIAVRDVAAVKARAAARGRVNAQGQVMLCGTRVDLKQA